MACVVESAIHSRNKHTSVARTRVTRYSSSVTSLLHLPIPFRTLTSRNTQLCEISCTATHSPHIVVDFSNAISLFVAWIFFVRTIHARLYHYHLTKLILSGCIRDQQNTTHLCLKCSDITQHPWLSSTAGVRSTGNFLVFPAVASPLKAPAVLRYEISLQDPMLIVYVLVSNAGVDVF